MPALDRPGKFRARVIETGLRKGKNSKSVGVSLNLFVISHEDPRTGEWVEWEQYGHTIYANSYVVKANGTTNANAVENLCEVFGWNGLLAEWMKEGRNWPECIITVDLEEYDGKTKLKVKWINPLDWTGGEISNMDPNEVQAIEAALGGDFRALAGNVARNKPKTETPVAVSPPALPPPNDGPPIGDADIPF